MIQIPFPSSKIYARGCKHFGGVFDFDEKVERLAEVQGLLQDPTIWDSPERAQTLGKESADLEKIISSLRKLEQELSDFEDLWLLAQAEHDQAVLATLRQDLLHYTSAVETLEFQRMFNHPMDPNNAFMDIQAGSGGTEAQDWAQMLFRMYLRWGERRGFTVTVLEQSEGDVAGIKSVALQFEGPYAYGWLRTETGVHRLVRKSPFDSGNRRHTSFASVFVSAEIEEDIVVDINPADLRIDTYRASGAGGQHVNRTDSAIRITHVPTNIVVQCQSDRSQHKNRANAMKQLRAKLYERQRLERLAEQQVLESHKADIGWGSQIRSYVLDQSRVKDLRTGLETTDTVSVLNGGLDRFIEASLKEGL